MTEEERLAAIQAYITSLQELNPDTVAWISIENTPINYPIVIETMKGQKAYQVFAALKLNELTPTSDHFYSAHFISKKSI